jgi:hypothetical protein
MHNMLRAFGALRFIFLLLAPPWRF